jgi:hypothetical protein
MGDNLTSKVPLPSIVHLGPGGGVALTALQGRFKECAAADYVPEESAEQRYRQPLRYVAIRIRQKHRTPFADGSTLKYFVVMTNL